MKGVDIPETLKPKKGGFPLAPEHKAKQVRARDVLYQARDLVLQYEADKLWDAVQSKDVPDKVIEYVENAVRAKKSPEEIRAALGIKNCHAPAWKKIMSAFNLGYRINGPALMAKLLGENMEVSRKFMVLVDDALANGTPMMDPSGNIIRVKGVTKEISSAVETLTRVHERFATIALKSGMLKDPALQKGHQGSGGVTIVIENNIPMPSEAEILAHQKEMQARVKTIQVQRQALVTDMPPSEPEPVEVSS